MASKLAKTALATCLVFGASGVGSVYAEETWHMKEGAAQQAFFAIPTAPPGMVPMIVYVPAQQMHGQPMAAPVQPIPPHTHAPQAAQTIDATHCSINDVAVLTQDAPSCEKAGGEVVAERASFGHCKSHPLNAKWPICSNL